MGRKLPNEPQHGELKANPAGGQEPETQLFKFPGRNLDSTRPARTGKKKKNRKVILDASTKAHGAVSRIKNRVHFLDVF